MPQLDPTPATFVIVFILLDIVSGVVKACATGTLASGVMRSGLWHKAASILLVVLSALCCVSAQMIEQVPDEFGLVYGGMCIYIIVMECLSIIENVCETNPDLKLAWLKRFFGLDKYAKEIEEGQDD